MNAQHPGSYPRRILLAVTGLSPQILTETLYALAATDQASFMPTEIYLLTTSTGKDLARTALLHPNGGQFHTLLADYPQIGHPAFDEAHIHTITGPDGTPLADIRSPAENASAADAITTLVAQLTQHNDASLHVSIAGGRKTMGFYLGYAFSLYARPQDRLSHVLVSSPFENHPEFFYPPATPRRLATRDGHHIDTANAHITLAEIPVVRLRHGLPQALQQGRAGFSETVAALQNSFTPPQLKINLASREARCGDQTLQLSPALLAWLAFWADTALSGQALHSWRTANALRYLSLYQQLVGIDSDASEKATLRLKDGMEKEFFEQSNSKLESALREQLGPAARHYLLTTEGRRPNTRRGLTLQASAITLTEA